MALEREIDRMAYQLYGLSEEELRIVNGEKQITHKEKFHKVIFENQKYLKTLGIRSIGIFGSVVCNEDTDTSDYDILVEFDKDKKSFKTFTALCDLFENHLGTNYEIVTKKSLSPYIGPHILEELEYVW